MDAGALLDILGNENRRRILQLLSRKPCYVTEISDHLGVSPKAVIDHLRTLEEAGLIESRTDGTRRKYFHIAENLRLEVTLAPYGFGMKSAYPASPNLDLSTCKYLSLEISRVDARARTNGAGADLDDHSDADRGPGGASDADPDPGEITALAAELDQLEDVERELSLAQRWVQGRISGIVDRLSSVMDDASYLDAEIITAVVDGASDPEEISREVEVPPPVVSERLHRLEERGVVSQSGGAWHLADT